MTIPSTIECPEMRLIMHDFEPPIFLGPGHIDIKSSTVIDFTMFAETNDSREASRRLTRMRENPYEISEQFRLLAIDYEGTEWNCGWTQPELKGIPKIGWPLTGKLTSMTTHATGPWVSTESGVELVFRPNIQLPLGKPIISVSSLDGEEVQRSWRPGLKKVQILDSEISFFYPPAEDCLCATAKTSPKLEHPYLENWIAEPLRILLGQLIFPRLVARNFGDGRAQVWLRPSPKPLHNSGIAALLEGNLHAQPVQFWELYSSLLTMIAEARNEQGYPNFEAHPITRFYEEMIQATQGSRWVLCMTLASSAEAIAKMLMLPEERKSKFSAPDVMSLRELISDWDGSGELKERVLGWFSLLGETSVASYLRALVKEKILKTEQERAWTDVRNAVMHGNLVSPWSTKKADDQLLALADLVHSLTRELIHRAPGVMTA